MKIENIIYMAYLPSSNEMIILTNEDFKGKSCFKYKCSYEVFCAKYLEYSKLKEKNILNNFGKLL